MDSWAILKELSLAYTTLSVMSATVMKTQLVHGCLLHFLLQTEEGPSGLHMKVGQQ